MMNEPAKPDTKASYQERILRVLVHIQTHLDEAIGLEALAAVAHFSPFHFHRVFRGMVGESVRTHVRRLRLERAAYRLKTTNQAVTGIAFEAGYETHESFTRAFHAMFGESPSAFREAHQPIDYPAVASGVHFSSGGEVTEVHTHSEETAMHVRIEQVLPMRVAFVRHTGPYDQVGRTWQRLFSWAGPRGLVGPMIRTLGVAYDDPDVTPPDRLRYDACLCVDDGVEPEGDVGVQEVGGGAYAVVTHRGPYDKLGETYARLCGRWLPSSGREPRSAPALEFYRNNPQVTKPDDLVTDVYVPLED